MMTTHRTIAYLCLITALTLTETLKAQHSNDSTIFKALRDEINKTIKTKQKPETSTQNYIGYYFMQGTHTEVECREGNLTTSTTNKICDYKAQLYLGSLQQNNGNLATPQFTISNSNKQSKTTNYQTIRQIFAQLSDSLYKAAAAYNVKQNASQKTTEQAYFPSALPIKKDFTQARTQATTIDSLKQLTADISSVFKNIEQISKSSVSAKADNATIYIVTSEGTEVKTPINTITITIEAAVVDAKGTVIKDKVVYAMPQLKDCPSTKTIKQDAITLANYLLRLKTTAVEADSYNGPVMLYNQAAASILCFNLFVNEPSLIAKCTTNICSALDQPAYNNTISTASKRNNAIISPSITVSLQPQLKKYKGINLIGAYDIDGEGVVPKEMEVISLGVLKSQINSRSTATNSNKLTGNHRIYIDSSSLASLDGPGVVTVTTKKQKSEQDLMQLLVRECEVKGLDKAYIIRPLISNCSYSPFCVYRIYLESMQETLTRSFFYNTLPAETLSNIIGCENKLTVTNFMLPQKVADKTGNSTGLPVSFITPRIIVIKDMTLNAQERPETPKTRRTEAVQITDEQ